MSLPQEGLVWGPPARQQKSSVPEEGQLEPPMRHQNSSLRLSIHQFWEVQKKWLVSIYHLWEIPNFNNNNQSEPRSETLRTSQNLPAWTESWLQDPARQADFGLVLTNSLETMLKLSIKVMFSRFCQLLPDIAIDDLISVIRHHQHCQYCQQCQHCQECQHFQHRQYCQFLSRFC